ncbi:MAG: hypothetical protein LBN74_08005 [Prevotella sp.]|jgi:hypothetical protein|nr:hypothetical protein [Prevotella sp.]
MKRIILFSVLIFVAYAQSSAQNYEAPKDYKFENKESYELYEPQVKETIDYLLQTSLGKDAVKRQGASAFLMAWLTGTPNVSVEINTDVIPFIKTNPELLLPYIAGCTKYALDNNYSKDSVLQSKAGIGTVVVYYRGNRGYLKKDASVEKYEKLIGKGKLEDEITKKMKKK